MESPFQFPLTTIGEPAWEAKLRHYLEGYDIVCTGTTPLQVAACEATLGAALPASLRAYYLAFGGSQNSDFMYGLLPVAELMPLATAGFEFVSLYFAPAEVAGMVWFADSPGNDPLCFDQTTGELYLFAHDPVQKAKVFTDFNQYLLFEIMQLEELLGDGIAEARQRQLADNHLRGEGIDYALRTQKL
jgi:hypothetical protein